MRVPPVLVPTIQGTKDNIQKGPRWLDVGLPLCIQPAGALLDVVLSAPDGRHQHLEGGGGRGCCIGRAGWGSAGPPGVASILGWT